MRKNAVVTLILIGLMTSCVVCIQPIKAEYQGNITINADGSVTPSTAPIQQMGDTYTLTSDVNGSITVLRSNIILDGNGHAIIGGPTQIGIGGLSIGCNFYAPTPIVTGASNVTAENLIVTGSVFGISLWEASNVTVANNTITGTGNGILALDQPTAGINVEGGGSNIITGNIIVNNYNAMSFLQTQNNLIIGNKIISNSNPYVSVSAVMFWHASNNTIYHNNFENNAAQAGDSDSVNVWDDGYPGGGNYWSDYRTRYPQAAEIDNSKIGDTPYVIDSQNMDRYPLMHAFNEYYVRQANPPKVSLLSPINQTCNGTSVSLVFTVDKAVNWTSYSLDGKDNVTITGNTTITGLSAGLHNITVYAKDEFENIGVSETIKFTIALVIHVLSPERRTYDTSSIPLNFTANSALAQITYCLNGEKNSTVSGNTTLNGLANGDYALTIYAKDEAGNVGASETILFTVDVPFPTTLVIVSVITVAVVGIGLLVYFKKRNR